MNSAKQKAKRIGVGVIGGLVVVVGVIAIPYPGPGWLIVFSGLAILATEFPWAQRILDSARSKYDGWEAWLKRQKLVVRLLILAGTAAVVIVTMWLLNVFGIMDNLLHLRAPLLHSPLGMFN